MADTSWMARVGARLVTNGYAILPIAPGTKKPGQFARAAWHDYPQWNRHATRATTEFEVATWSTWPSCGVGIVGGAVAALDIDVAEDGELALRIERLARERLGDTPRSGSARHRSGCWSIARESPSPGSGARRWKCSASDSSSWPMPIIPTPAGPMPGRTRGSRISTSRACRPLTPQRQRRSSTRRWRLSRPSCARRASVRRARTGPGTRVCRRMLRLARWPRSGVRSPGCRTPSSTTTAGCASAWR